MNWLGDLVRRLNMLMHRRQFDADLEEEMRLHLELRQQEQLPSGLTAEDAQAAARRRFGNTTYLKEESHIAWGWEWFENLAQDVRYGLRTLRKSPGFAAVAVLTLALGIGANTLMFSLVNGVLLRPLPYRHPDRLTMVWEKGRDGSHENVGYATYLDWKTQNKSFEELAIYSSWQPVLQVGEPEQLNGLRVTSNYFRVLGIHPKIGRDFLPEEDVPNANKVVMLSHSLWQRKFNSDPNIVGKPINMNATQYIVAGVLPASYQSLMSQDPRGGAVEIWRVLGYDVSQPWACRTCHHLVAIGRLRDGVAITQANAEMDTISAALSKAYPKEYDDIGVILTPIREQLLGPASTPLYILLGAVSLVLLVASANLANLLLARATHREREVAVRVALGASRGRIIRQLLAENCVLGLLGAAVGLIPAYWAPKVLAFVGTGDLPRLDQVHLDWRVLLFTVGVALLTGNAAGLAPAYRLSKTDVHDSLKEGSRNSENAAGRRLRGLLIVSEVALSLTLLISAGLLLRSLSRLLVVSPGFEPANVLSMQTSVLGQRFSNNAVVRQYFAEAVERLRVLPGVQSAAAASQIPLAGNMDRYGFHAEGKIHANPEEDPSAERYCITPGFLETMRIPLIRGRDVSSADNATAPQVLLIGETTARRMWPGEDPIGKRVKLGGVDQPWWTVVGVTGDVHHVGLDAVPDMQMYIPHQQWPYPDGLMIFVIRTLGPPAAISAAAQQAIHSIDRTQPISRIMPLEGYVGLSVQGRRFALILIGAFAAIGLALSVVGIYGVTAYTVVQRTREIGIRRALGAQTSEVLGLLLREEFLLILAGTVLGVAASLALTRFLARMLFEVKPTDPMTFALVVALLVSVAVLACSIPARRAMRVDPMVALRYE
ncbi:MAG: ABC transporter permease [Acidobacteria bacterium Pan2503]|uniref:ABC transporter permease n=1 Tax=Candidatus Acidiferrum panamense TaxID=2741543 RepID=A0A7V8SZU8_9BACT|nr:ABC transporter permease [Candidatus Acidoferrum panamensis]